MRASGHEDTHHHRHLPSTGSVGLADELDHLAGLVEHRIGYGVDMLDCAVEQHGAVGNVVRLLLPHRSRAHVLEQGPILGVNQLEKQVERHLGRCRIDAEYLPHLRRPEQFAGFGFSRPESGVTELPGLGQIGRRAEQVAFRLVAGGDVDRRRKIDRRARFAAGDRRDERIDPDGCSVLVPVSRHDFVVFARAVSKLGETGLARVAVPIEEKLGRRQVLHFRGGVAEHVLERLVGRDELHVLVHQAHAQRRHFENRAPALLACAERRFRSLANPYVAEDPAQLIDGFERRAIRPPPGAGVAFENRQHLVAENDREHQRRFQACFASQLKSAEAGKADVLEPGRGFDVPYAAGQIVARFNRGLGAGVPEFREVRGIPRGGGGADEAAGRTVGMPDLSKLPALRAANPLEAGRCQRGRRQGGAGRRADAHQKVQSLLDRAIERFALFGSLLAVVDVDADAHPFADRAVAFQDGIAADLMPDIHPVTPPDAVFDLEG